MAVCAMSSLLLLALPVSAAAAESETAFTPSAQFERWSHFRDYGVPAVFGKDALNSAAIADGSCRMIKEVDGFFYWHYPGRVQRVLQALNGSASTSNPSHFTLTTTKSLQKACAAAPDDAPAQHIGGARQYEVGAMAPSLQNWYHALCAPAEDPSWSGEFDPAYQPQQVALTSGFMCIVACDVMSKASPTIVTSLSAEWAATRNAICKAYPWKAGNSVFSSAKTTSDLAQSVSPLGNVCGCKGSQNVVV
jgi:hypothetical protein